MQPKTPNSIYSKTPLPGSVMPLEHEEHLVSNAKNTPRAMPKKSESSMKMMKFQDTEKTGRPESDTRQNAIDEAAKTGDKDQTIPI